MEACLFAKELFFTTYFTSFQEALEESDDSDEEDL